MAGKARRGRDIPQGISYKVNAPLLPWNKKGLEYLVGLYSHHSWKYKSTFCRRKTKSRDFFSPLLFGFLLSMVSPCAQFSLSWKRPGNTERSLEPPRITAKPETSGSSFLLWKVSLWDPGIIMQQNSLFGIPAGSLSAIIFTSSHPLRQKIFILQLRSPGRAAHCPCSQPE